MMLTEDRPVSLHAGNKYTKGPPPGLGGFGGSTGEVMASKGMESEGPLCPHVFTPGLWPVAVESVESDLDVFPFKPNPFTSNTLLNRSNAPSNDVLPNDAKARKAVPAGAVLDYFDSAIVEIAKALQDSNLIHNPGEPLHWSRGKSADHAHCLIRHYLQRGRLAISPTGAVIRHSTYMAIRALMLLQEELEAAGAPLSRGSKLPEAK